MSIPSPSSVSSHHSPNTSPDHSPTRTEHSTSVSANKLARLTSDLTKARAALTDRNAQIDALTVRIHKLTDQLEEAETRARLSSGFLDREVQLRQEENVGLRMQNAELVRKHTKLVGNAVEMEKERRQHEFEDMNKGL